jgi:hypothetical protein
MDYVIFHYLPVPVEDCVLFLLLIKEMIITFLIYITVLLREDGIICRNRYGQYNRGEVV